LAATGLPHAWQNCAPAATCAPQFEQNLGERLIVDSFADAPVLKRRGDFNSADKTHARVDIVNAGVIITLYKQTQGAVRDFWRRACL